MKFSSKFKLLLGLVMTLGLFAVASPNANAQSISYHPLKYGTNQTSMADGYFVKPAQVVVKDHMYYVTMQIKTAKSLSSYPVKVMWVNGRAPLNVRKAKDRAGNSHLYYSFYAKSLSKRINAKLAIDVPKVYKARHLISFKFSTAGLPSLGSAHRSVTTNSSHTTATTAQKAANSSTSRQPKSKANKTSSQSPKATKKHQSKKSTSKKAAKKEPKKASSSSSTQPAKNESTTSKPAKKTAAKPVTTKKSGIPWIVGGVTLIAGVSAGLWIYFRH